MDFNFKISEELLFTTALIQTPNIEGWVDLQNRLWEKYKTGYQLLQGDYLKIFSSPNYRNVIKNGLNDIGKLLEEGMVSQEYKKLLENAKNHKSWLESQWENNKGKIPSELKDILKVDLPKETSDVYVLGTLLHVGKNIDRKIFWGQFEHWPNYSLIYLIHEFLHNLFKNSKLEHSLIELISDNELRIRLNSGGQYFECEKEKVGHPFLSKINETILEDWKNYLNDKDINIYQLLEKLKEKYPDYL